MKVFCFLISSDAFSCVAHGIPCTCEMGNEDLLQEAKFWIDFYRFPFEISFVADPALLTSHRCDNPVLHMSPHSPLANDVPLLEGREILLTIRLRYPVKHILISTCWVQLGYTYFTFADCAEQLCDARTFHVMRF